MLTELDLVHFAPGSCLFTFKNRHLIMAFPNIRIIVTRHESEATRHNHLSEYLLTELFPHTRLILLLKVFSEQAWLPAQYLNNLVLHE